IDAPAGRRGPVKGTSDSTRPFAAHELPLHGYGHRRQARQRPEHDVQLADHAVLVDVEEVAPLHLTIPHTSAKDERVIGAVRRADPAGEAEVLKHPIHRREQLLDLRAAPIRSVDGGTAELHIVCEQLDQTIKVAPLDRTAERLHPILLLADPLRHSYDPVSNTLPYP